MSRKDLSMASFYPNLSMVQAHREQRRAESCRRGGRLEEAAECHGRAAKLLIASLALTSTPLARQSITLQHNYHLRQQELLRFRSKQLEKYVKAMENQRLKMGSAGGSSGVGSGSGSRELTSNYPHVGRKAQALSIEMIKNTEKFDSLLSLLMPEESPTEEGKGHESKHKENVHGNEGEIVSNMKDTLKETEEAVVKIKGTATSTEKVAQDETKTRKLSIGYKKEKDLLVIVEELRTLRDHQADLITQLMTDLSSTEKENILLKNQVRELQTKCEHYESERRRMRAMADSSCSPFVFSPLSEFSPDPPSVPDLAPLEMPPLDFMDNLEKDS
ncbi:uncharacterized protein [Panulirus ornatus]|uniref:uncharacterized protein isoform X2 n=1 Tax=Panulirus ornatus TaxID=150431 RepID=UPI003A856318